MPLVKRNIEPRHLCRGELPEGIGSELECVMNNTLSAIIRQLSSLSKHAEDIFGELFNEANTFYLRANSLQDRIDRLAIKVTQLDSTVEEVSLQDINMKKAFKSSTHQDQQVVSKSSVPIPVKEMYNLSDKPPPLNILSSYRDDGKEGLKFYTDPSYFFELWKEKMLQDTEDKRKEKRRQKDKKDCVDGTLQRQVKKVRKARNRRQEWNMMAFDKELRPDHRHTQSLHRGGSSEGSLSPENRAHAADHMDHCYPNTPNHAHTYSGPPPSLLGLTGHGPAGMEHDPRGGPMAYRSGTLGRPHQAPPPPPPTDTMNGSMVLPPVDYSMDYMNTGPPPPPPGPLIPSAQTAFAMPPMGPGLPTAHLGPMSSAMGYMSPPPPVSGPMVAPPPPGPPPPPPSFNHAAAPKAPPVPSEAEPATDARSDLLAAIRMGIQLKKVQEQQEQQAKREPVANDVATILSRRIAVEYSDSEDDSDLEDNDWSD
ncbi:wiskott-Aldrich syndrome protein family member 3b [Clupea harengus]|uniref:Wiskott-Aldrich syndrome protein family member n=1 Tax=Clupea harengus TaxID=7950 RepID=A0A6P8GPB8_CLUHA|nr:wiskott-Aldrich syndrome protein family member 3b [Clupea harengus]XP_031439610.1 wiskott-Aldrich syndrome protein family member 3b [Clupea harengus]XP_031439611.1 wiskott-Aldrich syndrome protein family member 3b [Clupea harengus]